MGVTIASAVYDAIVAAAAADRGHEVCGLLFGAPDRIDTAIVVRNVAADPEHSFEIDPGTLLAAHRAARADGPTIVGHYHSHPSGSLRPSHRDAEAAPPDGAIWLIVAGGEMRTWRAVRDGAVKGRFDPLELIVTAACA